MIVLLPTEVAGLIVESKAPWGQIGCMLDEGSGVLAVSHWGVGERSFVPAAGGWTEGHYTHFGYRAWPKGYGYWYRGDRELMLSARQAASSGENVTDAFLRAHTEGRWLHTKKQMLALTYFKPDTGPVQWAAWIRQGDGTATPITLDLFDHGMDLLRPLDRGWNRTPMAEALITVVGVGSVGGALSEALASYGAGRLALVDPDRLEAHNFARHRVRRHKQGQYKVDAVAEMLKTRDPTVKVEPLRLHVGYDADQIRPLLKESSLVICCADGPEARRTTTHLAFWARKPVVLACVLEHGAYGEIMSLSHGTTACLACNREASDTFLQAELRQEADVVGTVLDAQDPDAVHVAVGARRTNYAVDTSELGGISAVAGDLHLVAGLAAKTATAVIMRRAGYRNQRLPGSVALLGLQPSGDAGGPFARVDRAGEVAWFPAAAPSEDCPTCRRDQ